MREISYTFADGFRRGLRASSDNPRNNEALIQAVNVKVGQDGLMSVPELNQPLSATVDWPFPQLFIGTMRSFLCTRTSVYEIEDDWSLTKLFDSSAATYWSFADYGLFHVLCNGVDTYVSDTATGLFTKVTYSERIPQLSFIANLNGQLVGCGVRDGWNGGDMRTIVWSKVGQFDFTVDKTNVAGWTRMPMYGNAICGLKMGNMMVMYGDGGIVALIPVSAPTPTFETRVIAGFGIMGHGCVAGDDQRHVFVDEGGDLWLLDGRLTLRRLGYKEHVLSLGDDIRMSYDPKHEDFYISDSNKCYLLAHNQQLEQVGFISQFAMSSISQSIPTLAFTQGGLVGVASGDRGYVLIETDTLDFGIRALKTAQVTELGVSSIGEVSAAYRVRHATNAPWHMFPYVRANELGVVYNSRATGLDFRMIINIDSVQDVDIDYATIRMQTSDLRAIRGRLNVD